MKPATRTCVICGGHFKVPIYQSKIRKNRYRMSSTSTCAPECRSKAKGRSNPVPRKPCEQKCVVCGEWFELLIGANGAPTPRLTCTTKCRLKLESAESRTRVAQMLSVNRNARGGLEEATRDYCRRWGVTHPYEATMPRYNPHIYAKTNNDARLPRYRDDRVAWRALMDWCETIALLGRQPLDVETPARD